MKPTFGTPGIIRETVAGYIRMSLLDELLEHAEIQLTGEINADMSEVITAQLRYLHHTKPTETITIYIDSPGGDVSAGLAIYDMIQLVKRTQHIRTICTGSAASMAAVIFAAGDERLMLPHAYVMIHDPLIGKNPGGSALHVDSVSKRLMRSRDIIAGILAEHTGHTADDIKELTKHDTYFYVMKPSISDWLMAFLKDWSDTDKK